MDKEIISISKNKCCVTILIPLGFDVDNIAKKMECEQLANRITAIAKDLHVDYAVRANGNIRTAEISFTHEGRVTSEDEHKYEIKAIEFMKQIEKLDLPQPAPEPECPSHESDKTGDVEFVEKLLNDINLPSDDYRHVCGALIIDSSTHLFCPELTGWGRMSHDLLKEMCELYLKAHEE